MIRLEESDETEGVGEGERDMTLLGLRVEQGGARGEEGERSIARVFSKINLALGFEDPRGKPAEILAAPPLPAARYTSLLFDT